MESLYIDRRDTTLNVEGQRLLIHHPDAIRPQSVPLAHLRFVVISACTSLNSNVLQALSKAHVALIVLNPRKNEETSFTLPFRHGHAFRRLAQYGFYQDEPGREMASRNLVTFKIISQMRTLQRLLNHHPQQRRPLTKAMDTLRGIRESLRQTGISRDSLRGYEGAAASAYFLALTYCVPTGLQFTGRNRRPPADPVNAALSLTYTMLHYEAVRALCGVGLDPLLGFYHDLSYKRESLACDLVETLRARADYWVIRLFNVQQLRLDHFSVDEKLNGACLLGKAGRANYYAAYECQARHWRKLLRRVARRWANELMGMDAQQPCEDDDDEQPESDF